MVGKVNRGQLGFMSGVQETLHFSVDWLTRVSGSHPVEEIRQGFPAGFPRSFLSDQLLLPWLTRFVFKFLDGRLGVGI